MMSRISGDLGGRRKRQEVLLGSSLNEGLFPRKTRAIPQVVRMASPSPSTSSLVCESFSWTAAFISFKLWMVTILRARLGLELDMEPEYPGGRGWKRLRKALFAASNLIRVNRHFSEWLHAVRVSSWLKRYNSRMKSIYHGIPIFLVVLVVGLTCMGQAARAQAAAPSGEAQALVKQGQKLNNEGKQDEALKLYQQALEKSPNSYEAHLESGVALDLKGDYAAAREHLKKAIDVAPADQKNRAVRVMAFSYAFEGNSAEAEKYEKQVFDALLAKTDFEAAAGVANELARIKLESDDIDGAAKWYKTGYDTAMRKTDMKDADKNLWAFRWAHAQARMAARRGQTAEAQKQVAAAKAALDKANNPDQAPFFPYLTGYVAFYSGDYKTAITDLEQANQEDPFILVLLAQSYEKAGDAARAREYYGKVMANNGHGPTNAFARPLARKKLAGG
jgi:tetratricopeptide (TPR) repeat protein